MSDLVPTKTLSRTHFFGSNDGTEFNDCNTLGNHPYGMDTLDSRNPIVRIVIVTDDTLNMVSGLNVGYKGSNTWYLTDGDQYPSGQYIVYLNPSEYVKSVSGKAGLNSYYGVKTITQLSFTILDRTTSKERVEGPYGTADAEIKYDDFTVDREIFAFGGYVVPWEHTQRVKIIGLYFMVQGDAPGPDDPDLYARSATFDTTQPNVGQKISLKPSRKADNLPHVVHGLYHLDADARRGIKVRSVTEAVDKDSFQANIQSWGDSHIYAGGINCVDVPSGGEIQGGVVPYQSTNRQQRVSVNVTFGKQFDAAPKVICWLTGFDMDWLHNWRINMYNWTISETGFSVSVGTWEDSILHGIGISWFAVPADAKDVVVGTFTVDTKSQTKEVSFGCKLAGTPEVICALSEIDFGCGCDLIVKATVENTTSEGFTYNVKTEEGERKSLMFPTTFSYIAIVKHDQ